MNSDILKKRFGKHTVSFIRFVFLMTFSYILIYPLLFMLSNAVKSQNDIINPAVTWIAKSATFENFKYAFSIMEFPKSLINTLIYQIVSALLSVISCAVYAYALARYEFPLKKLFLFFLVLIIFVPDIVLIIPRTLNFRSMDFLGLLGLFNKITGIDLRPNLTDTVAAFYLPAILGVGLKGGMFIFIYMQFFKGLPAELEEAAWVDGAGPITTFVRIILPSSGVVILTVSIFSVIWHWNDWLYPIMYTQNNRTLSVMTKDIVQYTSAYVQSSLQQFDSERVFGIHLAACVLYILPLLIFYIILQKRFIQSIDRVGIVG